MNFCDDAGFCGIGKQHAGLCPHVGFDGSCLYNKDEPKHNKYKKFKHQVNINKKVSEHINDL